MAECTLATLLDRASDSDRGLRLLDRQSRPHWIGWHDIRARADRVCRGLRSLGIQSGDRVALIFPTGAEFFDAFFGVLMAGAIPVPLYPPARLGRLTEYHQCTAAMLRGAGVKLVLSDRRVTALIGQTINLARPELGCRHPADLLWSALGPVRTRPEDIALVQFSSGTTLEPKPVALTHQALIAQTVALNTFWPDTPEWRHSGVSWLPLYHDMGLIGCVFPALERPGTLTLIPPEVFVARPVVWLKAISDYRATISPAPNFAYGLCVEKIADRDLEGIDLGSWMIALNGAEPVAPEVLRNFQRRFAPYGFAPEALTPVYGLSEAALAVTFSDPFIPFTALRFDRQSLAHDGLAATADDGIELASVGRPLPGFDLKVLDPEGNELEAGQVGRIWVTGPSLMQGYLDRPEATLRVLRNGWLDTGDVGFVFDGELFITGRAKDVLILRGRNHPPEIVEQAVDGVDGVRTGCAVAVSYAPEKAETEHLVVFVEVRRGTQPTDHDAITSACSRAVLAATGLIPDRIVVLEPGSIPRTSSGKLRRQETLRLDLDDRLGPPAPVTPIRIAAAAVQSTMAFARLRWERHVGES